ncbi:MAG: RNA polymerase sigma factor [Bacteroidales bacterium]|jgi:RNA polymerase sigma-70 factor (ECF subfamily)
MSKTDIKNGILQMDELVSDLKRGNKKSFEKLFWDNFTSGLRFAKTFNISAEAADDILQEVFIGIWNNRASIENGLHFKSYFYKSIRNNAVKRITRQKNPLDIESVANNQSDDLFESIVQIEFNREVSRAIAMLPPKRRQIIIMAMKGMSAEEISDALGISVNTIKSQKAKAYTFLRNELRDIDTFLFFLLF